MQTITTIGFDIAKSVFQVHGVDAGGQVLIRRQLKRSQVLAFFSEAAFLSGWHRSLRLVSPLVTRAPGAWPYRAINAAGIRTTWLTQKRFAKPSPAPTCGSSQQRRPSSRAA